MAVQKICGIETEYGIIHIGANPLNPVNASSLLINAYVSRVLKDTASQWNFEDETPSLDIRGFSSSGQQAPAVETQLVNAVLSNGARYYVDHAHPEFSSPECSNALSALIYDQAGDEILRRSMHSVREDLEANEEIAIYKNNSDGKGNSYGCHENYLMDRATPFSNIVAGATAHFITRQIYTGAGKVGTEALNPVSENVAFQLSQRADFIEEEVGLETTLKRPIINTRDEPHSYAQHYRRFHVIVGDANISQTATFLKLGTTAFLLSMLEDEFMSPDFIFANPVYSMQQVSEDLDLSAPLELIDGNTITALEIQWQIFNCAKKYAKERGLQTTGEEAGSRVLELWEEVLTDLESNLMSLADRVDWIAKYQLLNSYRERHGIGWEDARLRALDIKYHDLNSEKSVAGKLKLKELVDSSEVENAITNPPEDTRAYFRGICLQKFASEIVAVNWDSIVFNLGEDSLKRLSMMEPAKGTKQQLEKLLDSSSTLSELLEKIDT